MKTLSKKISIITGLIALLGFSTIGHATDADKTSNQAQSEVQTQTQAKTQPTARLDGVEIPVPEKVIQDFQQNDLTVQFRYLNGKLHSIKLTNVGKNSIELNILNETYNLSPNNYVVLVPPHLKHIIVRHQPSTDYKTTVGNVLKSRFQQQRIYNMPDNYNSHETTKSTPPQE